MNLPASGFASGTPPEAVPVLSQVVAESEIPDSLLANLEALALEKAAYMNLAKGLIEDLRPELERLLAEAVHRSLQQAWINRTTNNR